jgi:putative oxidoreductase
MANTELSKGMKITAWVLSALLTLSFLLAGGGKLAAVEDNVATFAHFGYPLWFMYVTGAIEVLCAAGLWIPRLRGLSALGLVVTMLGAVATHLIHDGVSAAIPAIVMLALSGAVTWLRRGELLKLAGRSVQAGSAGA